MIENYNIFEEVDGEIVVILRKLVKDLAFKEYRFNPMSDDFPTEECKIITYDFPRGSIALLEIIFCYHLLYYNEDDYQEEFESQIIAVENKITEWLNRLSKLEIDYIKYEDDNTFDFGNYEKGILYRVNLSALPFSLSSLSKLPVKIFNINKTL